VLVDCEVSAEARRAAGLESIVETRVQQVNNAQEMVYAICSCEDKDMAGMFAMLTSKLGIYGRIDVLFRFCSTVDNK
jgi:hypothetical protein